MSPTLVGSFYFKPEAGGRMWLSPHDETPVEPHDAAPEEIDVAIAIDRLEQVVDWRIAAVERRWAGLRSFAPDRLPVYGFDAEVAGLLLVRGTGRLRHPDRARCGGAGGGLLLPDRSNRRSGIDPSRYAPGRFVANRVSRPREIRMAHKFVIEKNKAGELSPSSSITAK